MLRDSLDFKTLPVGKLFNKQLYPALLGMISTALFTVVDGIFVGRGIGSDALAAINIAVPVLMLMTGIGLMFGMGGGILASINLSRGKNTVANINVTQSTVILLVIIAVITLFLTLFTETAAKICGSDDYLLPQASEYLFWFSLAIPFAVMTIALPFFVRQTNPRLAMWAMLLATAINIVLDYTFIFVFKWGLFGAAIATAAGEATGGIILFVYLLRPKVAVRFAKLKLSYKSMLLTLRNGWYMVKLGISSFLSEIALAIMAITGNYVFMDYTGTDGVAAYSIVCYLFPIIYMVFNAIVQAAQPIISYNYGCGQMARSNRATKLSIYYAVGFSVLITVVFIVFSDAVVSLFIPDRTTNAFMLSTDGLSLFALDYVFFGINIVAIGYYTSIERVKRAINLTILRGVLPVIFFFTLPKWLGVPGIWVSVAAADCITTIVIAVLLLSDRMSKNGRTTDNKNMQPV